ncbi:aquaporin-like protein [Epithele typhae]|uniref:aquaporin-like protein n=1 Tax=Epithele typhae TaxID=378194 RepID=UPI002007ABC5|nr:aquaporin-like protein [Epithele typhae]KAH9945413.1 aquaporin-like protein [Epithele typhae]
MSFSSHRQTLVAQDQSPDVDHSHKFQTKPPGYFDSFRDDLTAAALEFVGTTVFLLLAFGGVQAAAFEAGPNPAQSSEIQRVMYVSLCFGMSLLVSAWLFFRVTGGLFNPDVSLALLITGCIGPVRFVLYCIAQLLGGIAAAAIVLALTPGPLASNTFPAPGINKAQAVFIEMFTTSVLVLSVLMLAAEKHNSTPFAPIGIGLTLFMGHMWSVAYTGAGINTARSFGPAVVTGFPYNTQWIYWVGPFLGSLLGSGFYTLLKHINYWHLNPNQDAVDYQQSPDKSANLLHSVLSSHDGRGHSVESRCISDLEKARSAPTTENGQAVSTSGTAAVRPNDSAV